VFHYFTIKFHFSFFAYFRFKFFASLHLSNFCFEAKQSEAKFKSIFFVFFAFFAFFTFFALNFRFARFFHFSISNFASEAKVRAHPTLDTSKSRCA
jgi:hypothetical protein